MLSEATDNNGRRRHSVIDRRGFLERTAAIAAAGLGAAAFGDSRPMAATSRVPGRDAIERLGWEPSPDPAHLLRWGRGWKVLPTGH